MQHRTQTWSKGSDSGREGMNIRSSVATAFLPSATEKCTVVFNSLPLLGELRKKTLQKCGSVAQERRGTFHAYGFD